MDDASRINLQNVIQKAVVLVQEFNKQLLWGVSLTFNSDKS